MKRVVVTLEQVKETKGTYRYDSPDPEAASQTCMCASRPSRAGRRPAGSPSPSRIFGKAAATAHQV